MSKEKPKNIPASVRARLALNRSVTDETAVESSCTAATYGHQGACTQVRNAWWCRSSQTCVRSF